MAWIFIAALQCYFIVVAIRRERSAGVWSSSKFAFTLLFAALQVVIMMPAIFLVPIRYQVPAIVIGFTIVAMNFVWFIIACRRWRLPDGRTSLEAYRELHDEEV